MVDPVWGGGVAFTPEGLEDALGPFDLLDGGGQAFAAFWEVRDVADEELGDAFLAEDGVEEHDDGLLVGEPSAVEHFAEEPVAEGEELAAGALGVLADFAGLEREPIVEEGEGAVGIDEVFGVVVLGGDFADAEVLVKFGADFGQVMEAAEDILSDGATVVEVAGDEPVDVVGAAAFVGRAEAGVPHLAGIDAPGLEDIGVGGDLPLAELLEGLAAEQVVGGLAVQDGDGAGVGFGLGGQSRDEVVELFEVVIVVRGAERVDDDRVDEAAVGGGGGAGGAGRRDRLLARRGGFHGRMMDRTREKAKPNRGRRARCFAGSCR